MNRYDVYDYLFAYAPRNWTVSGSHDGKTWKQVNREDEPPVDSVLRRYTYTISENEKPYHFYRYYVIGDHLADSSCEDNKGSSVTWLPEFFPYVCNRGFEKPLFPNHHLRLGFHSNFVARSSLPQGVRYSVTPPLPEGVGIDEEGSLFGSFVGETKKIETQGYEGGTVQFYTITAEDEVHREEFAISVELRGATEERR